jgi:predicted DNA-binding transcriptional regulator AlpA
MGRLLNIEELADYLGIGVGTIYGWRKGDSPVEGPPAIRVGKSLRWRQQDVEEWLDAQTKGPSSRKAVAG